MAAVQAAAGVVEGGVPGEAGPAEASTPPTPIPLESEVALSPVDPDATTAAPPVAAGGANGAAEGYSLGGPPPFQHFDASPEGASAVATVSVALGDDAEDIEPSTPVSRRSSGASDVSGYTAEPYSAVTTPGAPFSPGVMSPLVATLDDEDDSPRTVKPGDCVWAKYTAKPNKYWPAKVLPSDGLIARWMAGDNGRVPDVAPPRPGKDHLCHFFGSYDWAWMAPAKVAFFDKGYERFKKSYKSKIFDTALREAELYMHERVQPVKMEVETLEQLMELTSKKKRGRRADKAPEVEAKRPKVVTESERLENRQKEILRYLGLRPPLPLKEWGNSTLSIEN